MNNISKVNYNGVISTVGVPVDGVAEAVNEWLDDHPEATTTVQDSSLTEAKFTDDLKLKTVKDYVTPEMYGAKGDGVTDDTTAVQRAFTEALSKKVGVVADGEYLISNTITVTNSSEQDNSFVNITGKLLPNFSNKPCIIFENCSGWKINVNAQSKTANPFGGYNFSGSNYHYGALPYVGVVLRNANRCEFSGYLRNFNVGLRLEGLNGGSVYNFIHGVSVWNCAYGIELYANTSGWVNSNKFDANTVSVNSDIANRDKAVAVHLFSSYNYPNNCNVFEGDYMSADGCPSVVVENGQFNEFLFRNEGNNTAIIDGGNFNTFEAKTTSDFTASGANQNDNAISKLLNSFEMVANITADNVDVVAWKNASSNYYAKSGNIVEYGVYASGGFQNEWYGESSPIVDGIPARLGVFVDVKNNGAIATYIEKYLDTDSDIRTHIYLFDENKNLISPTSGYVDQVLGGSFTKDTSNMRLVAGGNSNRILNMIELSSSVRYVFVTASNQMKTLRVYAKKTVSDVPCVSHYTDAFKYPLLPISNTSIITSHKKVGKRYYSTNNGAEYICSAVTDGAETWVQKSIS